MSLVVSMFKDEGKFVFTRCWIVLLLEGFHTGVSFLCESLIPFKGGSYLLVPWKMVIFLLLSCFWSLHIEMEDPLEVEAQITWEA